MKTKTIVETFAAPIEHLREELGAIELDVLTKYTLADAMREGSAVTKQSIGSWGGDNEACALSAAMIAAKARGFV